MGAGGEGTRVTKLHERGPEHGSLRIRLSSLGTASQVMRDIHFVYLLGHEEALGIILVDTGFQKQAEEVRVDVLILFHGRHNADAFTQRLGRFIGAVGGGERLEDVGDDLIESYFQPPASGDMTFE